MAAILGDELWPRFSRLVPASHSVAKSRFGEIELIRNAVAHFRPILERDVSALSLAAEQLLSQLDQYLGVVFGGKHDLTRETIPTWLMPLLKLGSDSVLVQPRLSKCQRVLDLSIRVTFERCGEGTVHGHMPIYYYPGIDWGKALLAHPDLLDKVLFISRQESETLDQMGSDDSWRLYDMVELVLSAETLKNDIEGVSHAIANLVHAIEQGIGSVSRGKGVDHPFIYVTQALGLYGPTENEREILLHTWDLIGDLGLLPECVLLEGHVESNFIATFDVLWDHPLDHS